MAINFPSSPGQGDSHIDGNLKWIYNGSAWDSFYEASAPSQVGLGNVDNTSDEDKPVSTAQQAALDALTKDDVGLDNVDNTSDINKPVSTAQQAAIDAAGGGSSFFDQDLNTTDSPTFATLTTTDTIATDVYTVDLGATGTVTAANIEATSNITIPAYKNLSFGSTTYSISNLLGLHGAGLSVKSWAYPVRFSGSAGIVMDVNTNSGGVDITGDLDATGTVKKGVYTVAALPTGEAGMTCFVSDANATTRGSTVAGGGANFMPVYSDGTNWIIS